MTKTMHEIYLNGTRMCNLSCNYCAVKDEPPGDYAARMATLETLVRPGCRLTISGGEPLLDQRLIDDVLGLIKRRPEEVSALAIFTNGLLLTKEIHNRLLTSGLIPTYVVSADSSEKSFLHLLEVNPEILDISFQVSYIIAGAEDVRLVAENINQISEYTDNVGIVYNKFRFADIPFIVDQLTEQIKMTSFMPRRHDVSVYTLQCERTYINFDGTISGCDSNLDPKEWPKLRHFQKCFCSQCQFKLYCRNCGPYIYKENYNTCLFTKALCANIIEEGRNVT